MLIRSTNRFTLFLGVLLILLSFRILFSLFAERLSHSLPQGVNATKILGLSKARRKFNPILSEDLKSSLLETFVTLTTVCEMQNLTYMMYSGTLIGSYRHHDLIPWDDDIDILMNYTERSRILSALSKVGHGYMVTSAIAGSRLKFYSNRSIKVSRYPWKWPFVDISFFSENQTHIWDNSMAQITGHRSIVFPKSTVFPLHPRPLGPYFFASPKDAYFNIRHTYTSTNLAYCSTSRYSHKYEKWIAKTYNIYCEALKYVYPFVHRSLDVDGVRETLMFGNTTIHSWVVDEPKYAITEPYRIKLK